MYVSYKNPAYRRQSIPQPMRIVALVPKNPASKAKIVEKSNFFVQLLYIKVHFAM